MVLLEVCVESVESARAAEEGGAQRVEVCQALVVGGLTPSPGLLAAVLAAVSIPVHVLVRPRDGDFVYSPSELDIIRRDIAHAKAAGAHGVVVGCLLDNGEVDIANTAALAAAAHPLHVTFHRAIDQSKDCLRALRAVGSIAAIDRVLTSGGAQTCELGVDTLARMNQLALAEFPHLTVLCGGGLTEHNVRAVLQATGAREVHGSLREALAPRSSVAEGEGGQPAQCSLSALAGALQQTSVARVRACVLAMAQVGGGHNEEPEASV